MATLKQDKTIRQWR